MPSDTVTFIELLFICRRHSKEFVERLKPQTTDNEYSRSPRQSEAHEYDEEVYNELDESQMQDGLVNAGYIEPVDYDEIDDVKLRRDGIAEYVNQPVQRPDSEDYLTPNGTARHSSEDYLNAGNVLSHDDDYLDPERPPSADYLDVGRPYSDQNFDL